MERIKRSFSTVGCIDYDPEAVICEAVKHNMDGVEVRLDQNNKFFGLDGNALDNAVKKFSEVGLKVTNLGTNVTFLGDNSDDNRIYEAEKCILLAKKAGAKAIRIFLGTFSNQYNTYGAYSYEGIVKSVRKSADIAKKHGIELWVETHNDFSEGKVLKKLLEDCEKDNIKIIWDIMHPMERGETPSETVKYLKDKIAHLHFKDGSRRKDRNKTNYLYEKLGFGEVPVDEIIKEMKNIGYTGFASLEWENAWRPEIRTAYKDLDEILDNFNRWMDRAENNILPTFSDESWSTYMPDCKEMAQFRKGRFLDHVAIDLQSESFGIGKWVCEADIEGGKTYSLDASCDTESDMTDVHCIFTVLDNEGNWIIREHLADCEKHGSRIFFSDLVEMPEKGEKIVIELWLKGNFAEVKWNMPHIIPASRPEKRPVKISVAYIKPDYERNHTLENNLTEILSSVDKAAEDNSDLIVLGEAMYDRGCGLALSETAEQVESGKACSAVRDKARLHHCYIVYNFHEYENGEYYNTSMLIGRKGEIIGKYRKTHLTITELEKGMTPGTDYPVFETDFGKVGMLICYDHYFASAAEKIAQAGAEIVCVSTAGDSNAKGIARAMDTGVYYAICGLNTENSYGWGPGRIIAPDGKILSHTNRTSSPAVYEIDLNQKVRRCWLSLGPADSCIRGVYKYEKNTHA